MKAIATIRALSSRSNYGSLPRPPAENRIKLYGLYKQATEGNVEGVMSRPVGYTIEDEGAKKKWDAWKKEEGLSKTEAKRCYILYLIETMKVYASGTQEARELLNELEYLWDQIKDIQYNHEDEFVEQAAGPYPPISPLLTHSDRYSTTTPLPLTSNVSIAASNQQYRNNLQKIYSHSRRGTMLSLHDYINQSAPSQSAALQSERGAPRNVAGSFKERPSPKHHPKVENPDLDSTTLRDLKTWQGEINLIINKLSREYLNNRSNPVANRNLTHKNDSESECDSDVDTSFSTQLRRRILALLKIFGLNLLKALRNFSASTLTILFIVWCVKRNVKVQQTLVTEPIAGTTKRKKELLINISLNTDENKWFIRLLRFVNSFVRFI